MRNRLRDFLIPHKGNNYRPDFLERVSVGIMLVLILLSFSIANLQALFWVNSDWLVSAILPAVIVDLTNEERDIESLTPLTRSKVLDEAATLKAKDMAQGTYFAHYSPTGVSPWHWFDEVGYDYLHAGENLAVHFTESGEVVEAWMASPSHRANIMNGQYMEIGVGSAKGEYNGRSTIFVVQLFGIARMSQEAVTQVAGITDTASSLITIEKIATGATTSDVAPASLEVRETAPKEVIAEKPLLDVPLSTTISAGSELPLNDSLMVYTSLATTSREGEPLLTPATTDDFTSGSSVSLPLRSTTEASLWLETLYAVLAFFVIVALATSITLEWRRHHPVQIAYAGGLLAVMALLLYVHTSLTSTVLIT